ncbi:MAG: carbohydrate kinase family protein [Actinomycetota bacterium]
MSSSANPSLLCIGDVMLDVVAIIKNKINFGSDTPSSISTHGGGAAGNVAAWARIKGAPTHIVARVGDDAAGIAVLSEFDSMGISHTGATIKDERTGVVVVLVDKSGERTMFPESGANSGLTFADLPDLAPFSVVYLSGYALLNEESRPEVLKMIASIRQHGIPIYFDPATVGGMSQVDIEEVRSWLPLMSGLFMNEEEAAFLTGQMDLETGLDLLLNSAPLVVIKRGPQGAIGKNRDGEKVIVTAVPTQVIDTTGAGDSFAGGYIARWLSAAASMSACTLAQYRRENVLQ